jgi:beta-N-acetylhexosaminidase
MDIRTMAGQRLCVGFTGTEIPPEIRDAVREYKIGNVILFSRNIASFGQLRSLCADLSALILAETGLPPFIMIDEECGVISRLGHLTGDTPCAGALGCTGDPENARAVGRIVGKRLRAAGVNMNLAPVLDCLSQPGCEGMPNRRFSPDPEQVARFGLAYLEGLRESGILACGKHFPGHGDTVLDTHFALPTVDKPLEALERTELVPFRAAVRSGIEAVMTAHIRFPALDPERPATISPAILRGLLRERLGFGGIIVSDGMEMQAMLDLFPVPEGVFRALNAGVDISLVCDDPPLAAAACERVLDAVRRGDVPREDLEEHFRRIQRYKAALPAPGPAADFSDPRDRELSVEIMARSVRLLHAPEGRPLPATGRNTLFWARPARRSSPVMDGVNQNAAVYAAGKTGSSLVYSGTEPLPDALPDTAVFFLERENHLEEGLAEAARMAAGGTKVVCVALDTPFVLDDAPENAWHIVAWQYQPLALDAVLRLLKKEGAAQ